MCYRYAPMILRGSIGDPSGIVRENDVNKNCIIVLNLHDLYGFTSFFAGKRFGGVCVFCAALTGEEVDDLAVYGVGLCDELALRRVRAVCSAPVVTTSVVGKFWCDERFEFTEFVLQFVVVIQARRHVVEFVLASHKAVAVFDALCDETQLGFGDGELVFVFGHCVVFRSQVVVVLFQLLVIGR